MNLKQSINKGVKKSERVLRTEVKDLRTKMSMRQGLNQSRKQELDIKRSSSILSLMEKDNRRQSSVISAKKRLMSSVQLSRETSLMRLEKSKE